MCTFKVDEDEKRVSLQYLGRQQATSKGENRQKSHMQYSIYYTVHK
jgi:hypothetical protein